MPTLVFDFTMLLHTIFTLLKSITYVPNIFSPPIFTHIFYKRANVAAVAE
jgi:hypothetical protein